MSRRIKNVIDVAEYQLCSGCGACAFMDPEHIQMVDDFRFGRRPYQISSIKDKEAEANALQACPGISLHRPIEKSADTIPLLRSSWGQVRSVYEGYSSDEEVRFEGSSGGLATALALHCLQNKGFSGVLHTAARKDVPYLNETVVSTSREELLARAGSRYAPSSPCDGLQAVLDQPGKFVFIGKPCDVAAVQKIMQMREDIAEKIGLTIAIFCAGTPSTQGTLDLMKASGVKAPKDISSVRYRGQGWPGNWTVKYVDGAEECQSKMSYKESWKFLSKYKQWRCHICPDHIGEFADISVGDPWYRTPEEGDLGTSLILPRSKKGMRLLEEAEAAGLVCMEERDPSYVLRSHPTQPQSRGMIFGRILGLRLACTPVPVFKRFFSFIFWMKSLTIREKWQSTSGAMIRALRRGLHQRQRIMPSE